MKNTHLYARPAGSAVVAALAFLATPAIAQDASAPVVIAETPPASAAPTIVIPDPIVIPESEPAATMASEPAPVAATERSSQTSVVQRRAPVRSEPVATAARSEPAPVLDSASIIETAPASEAQPLAEPVAVAAPIADASPATGLDEASSDNSTVMMAAGGAATALAVLGLFMAASARRRRRAVGGEALARPAFEPEAQRHTAAATPAPASTAAVAPAGFVVSHAVNRDRNFSKWDDPVYVDATPAAVAGRSVPNTPEGRKALIDRLVRARPDRTNPFRSLAARRRRARLIVQSLAQRMQQQPNLDFRRFYDSFGRRDPAPA